MDKVNLLKQKIDEFIRLHNELTHLYGQLKPSKLAPYWIKRTFANSESSSFLEKDATIFLKPYFAPILILPKKYWDVFYLGEYASPDTKYGGYEFDLFIMLRSFADIFGKEGLAEYLKEIKASNNRLKDKRVRRVLADIFTDEKTE